MKKHTVKIEFANAEDCAYFLGMVERQFANRAEQLTPLYRTLMATPLQRAKSVKASMTSEEAKIIRAGVPTRS